MSDKDILSEIERVGDRLKQAKHEVAKRVIGQEKVVDLTMNALLSRRSRAAGRRAGSGENAPCRHAGHGHGG